MRNSAVLFLLLLFTLTVFPQKPTPKKTPPKTSKTPVKKTGGEKEEFEKAATFKEAAERIAALQKFIEDFPKSGEITRARELIVSARAQLGDQKLQTGETAEGIALFKLAVEEAPTPFSDALFTQVILGFPLNLYALDQRDAAFEVEQMIEEKCASNPKQILDLSKFFINIQYGTKAIELAKKAAELAPESSAAYQTLGIALRLNFRLEESAAAYAKAIELDQAALSGQPNLAELVSARQKSEEAVALYKEALENDKENAEAQNNLKLALEEAAKASEAEIKFKNDLSNRQSVADLKRALEKPDEAIALYREILAKDPANAAAQTGLTLALFDAGKQTEAEKEMKKALEANSQNPLLLAGAAYWYAAHNNGAKAIELGEKAVAIDPSLVWGYIAQARGYLRQKKPLEAERVLLLAKKFGDFPTLDYELASARLAAGFYRDAAESLKKNFAINQQGLIETYLGNRILADAPSFIELLSLERKTLLFAPTAADSPENAEKLKSLLNLANKLEAKDTEESELTLAADEFVKGDDNMKLHRQLFAASRLLQKKAALPKVLELMQASIGGVDKALDVASPSAAVLSDEIYSSRQYAISQNQVVIVPEIPRQTLSAILRGRIEDITGWALYEQKNMPQAVIRLKRALSVLPEKSVWLRNSSWHLGIALEADGKEKEALDAYLKGYDKDFPDLEKRAVIEALYQKVNGNLDGLEARIGPKPESPTVAASETNQSETSNTDNVKTAPEATPSPEASPETSPTPKTEETPAATPDKITETNPLPENLPLPSPEKTPETIPETIPETTPSPTPAVIPETTKVSNPSIVNQNPEISPKVEPVPTPTPAEIPKTETPPDNSTTPETTPTPEPSPKTEATPVQTDEIKNPSTEIKPEPTPQTTPTPENTGSKTENRSTETAIQPSVKTTPSNTPKPLFEPVIITVPKNGGAKNPTTETKPINENSTNQNPNNETVAKNEPVEIPKPENKATETAPTAKAPLETDLSGETRPRMAVVVTDKTQTNSEEIKPCKLVAQPEMLPLLNGGGSLGVLVGFEGSGDLKQITARSSSPNDVEVVYDSEFSEGTGRSFFVVKSITTKTGVFTVIFESPCGKKEILVRVR